jgi:hypothetical protein
MSDCDWYVLPLRDVVRNLSTVDELHESDHLMLNLATLRLAAEGSLQPQRLDGARRRRVTNKT